MLKPTHARFIMILACLLGLFASVYLLYTYVSGAPIRCGVVSGCEIVRASRWAYTFGIPRPLLGLIFYAALFGLLVIRASVSWKPRFLYHLTMLAAVIGFIESAFLFLVQWLDIRAFCLWCLISALAATVIILAAPFDRSEEPRISSTNQELKRYFVVLLIFLPLAGVGFFFLMGK